MHVLRCPKIPVLARRIDSFSNHVCPSQLFQGYALVQFLGNLTVGKLLKVKIQVLVRCPRWTCNRIIIPVS